MNRDIEFLRVKAKDTGHETTIPAVKYDPDLYTKVKAPAVDSNGDPLPATPKTSASSKSGDDDKSGQKAASEKENS